MRAVNDERLKAEIARVHAANYGVYGIRKIHAQLAREHVVGLCDADGAALPEARPVARCTTQRLMRELGLRGISRAKGPRTTIPGAGPDERPDLVDRHFRADAPDRLWVADLTYGRTFAGWIYAAFVLDVFSRAIVGWQLSTSLRTDLALDALDMGLWTRQHEGHDTSNLIHHSDQGVQGEFNRWSQHPEFGGVQSWRLLTGARRPAMRPRGFVVSGVLIGRCGRRCARPAGRIPRGWCSDSSGG